MQFRKSVLAFATIAAISPVITNASPQKVALNACARAFATSIASPGTAAPSFKLNYSGDQEEGPLAAYYSHQFTFYLHAHDAKTGLALANATCSADSSGTVIALSSTPLDAAAPTLAAKL
jgi:hypothetical protein